MLEIVFDAGARRAAWIDPQGVIEEWRRLTQDLRRHAKAEAGREAKLEDGISIRCDDGRRYASEDRRSGRGVDVDRAHLGDGVGP